MVSDSVGDWVDQLQQRGRYTFTKNDVLEDLNKNRSAVEAAIRRLKEKGRLVQPRQEFYIIVPLEYRSRGAPPPSWYIHDLMEAMDQSYYVGLLTAAQLYGAAHQRPQEFQVICEDALQVKSVGKARLRFVRKKHINRANVTRRQTETGYMRLSTPEQTAIDLLRYVRRCGYLNNVATVLKELGSELGADGLREVAVHEEKANVQRLGYLLEQTGHEVVAQSLHSWLQEHQPSRVPLQKGGERTAAQLDDRWKVYVNTEIETDV